MELGQILDKIKENRNADAKAFEALDKDLCMLCGAYGADKRSWQSSCFYAIDEAVPEALDLKDGFYLRICKSCRGRYLEGLRRWREECVGLRGFTKDHDGYLYDTEEEMDPERNIPVRRNGVTVLLTREEWDHLKKKE